MFPTLLYMVFKKNTFNKSKKSILSYLNMPKLGITLKCSCKSFISNNIRYEEQ